MEEAIFPEAHSQALYTYLHQNWFYLYLFYLKNFSHSGIFDALATTFTSFLPCLTYSQSLSFQNVSYSFLESLQMGYPLSGKLSPASLEEPSDQSDFRLPITTSRQVFLHCPIQFLSLPSLLYSNNLLLSHDSYRSLLSLTF